METQEKTAKMKSQTEIQQEILICEDNKKMWERITETEKKKGVEVRAFVKESENIQIKIDTLKWVLSQ